MNRKLLAASMVLAVGVVFLSCNAASASEGDAPAVANVKDLKAGISDGKVVLSWTDPDDSAFANVEISGDGFATLTAGKGVRTAAVNGLTNGTAYGFIVKSVTSSGTKSSGVSVTATPFESVSDAYIWYGNGQVTLRYGDPKTAGSDKVEIAGTDVPAFTVANGSATWGSTPVSGLVDGKSYSFTIRVVDKQGNRETAGVSLTGTPGLYLTEGGTSVPEVLNLVEGNTKQLYAKSGASTVGATWESSNTSVATVDSSGLVTGVAGGLTSVKATYGSYATTVGVAVWQSGETSYAFMTTDGAPDARYSFNQGYRMQLASDITFPISATAVKISGSERSNFGFDLNKIVGSTTYRMRFELRTNGQYRIRRLVDTAPTVLVPWTSHSAIHTGLDIANTVELTQETPGVIGIAVNGTTIQTVTDPDSVDYAGGSAYARVGLATSYHQDYSSTGQEIVQFSY